MKKLKAVSGVLLCFVHEKMHTAASADEAKFIGKRSRLHQLMKPASF
ncbi:hypothetical protein [Phocaeicola salanitronis]|nr:hypothetical protein [Phocaeicola salanitronis]MDM8306643.1 hypothetical protein [Phocaeicola salanitronis]